MAVKKPNLSQFSPEGAIFSELSYPVCCDLIQHSLRSQEKWWPLAAALKRPSRKLWEWWMRTALVSTTPSNQCPKRSVMNLHIYHLTPMSDARLFCNKRIKNLHESKNQNIIFSYPRSCRHPQTSASLFWQLPCVRATPLSGFMSWPR